MFCPDFTDCMAPTRHLLNTDHDVATGKQAFGGPADTGAEYYIKHR
jgi:hypothetical protein